MDDLIAVQKSQLAKLMATENLTVEHRKVHTAMFDAQKRILILPIWKDMDVSMYDHLTGHEVGHAIWTPTDGWHNAVVKENKGKYYKSFLNVIEDVRIEKKIQRKYPGLKKSFVKSFGSLMEKDFFGIKYKNVQDLPFIDRLNIFSKSQYTEDISFSDLEQVLVDKAKAVETWDDVLRVTNEIYEFSKEELIKPSTQQDDFGNSEGESESDPFDDYDQGEESDDEGESSEDGEDPNKGESSENDSADSEDGKPDSEESDNSSGKENEESDEGDGLEGEDFSINHGEKESRACDCKEQEEPRCLTDEIFRSREHEFLSEKAKDYVYFQFPEPNLKNIIVPANIVQKNLSDCFDNQKAQEHLSEHINKTISDFRKYNDRYVSLLAKEFEMRKAAKRFSKTKISFSGDLNINKISNYKFDENLFKKVAKSPNGKSHGLVILLDYSGSMSNNMSGSIEQIIVLTAFCRKVNIPFKVFAFSNSTNNASIDGKIDANGKIVDTFVYKNNSLFMNNGMFLREYVNSEMANAEYKKAIENMIILKMTYEHNRRVYRNESLGNTPLIEAIVACKDIMVDFKKKNNLDITSLVIVQDGDADSITNTYDEENKKFGHLNDRYQNIFLSDRKNKIQIKLEGTSSNDLTKLTLEWFKKTTNSKVIGFFIVPDSKRMIEYSLRNRYVNSDGTKIISEDRQEMYIKTQNIIEKIRKDKFLISNNASYDKFFMVLGGKSLQTDDDSIFGDKKDLSINQIKNLFLKQNKKREVNRVFVNKFIEIIASE